MPSLRGSIRRRSAARSGHAWATPSSDCGKRLGGCVESDEDETAPLLDVDRKQRMLCRIEVRIEALARAGTRRARRSRRRSSRGTGSAGVHRRRTPGRCGCRLRRAARRGDGTRCGKPAGSPARVRSTTAERPAQSKRTAVPAAGRSDTWQTNCQLAAKMAAASSGWHRGIEVRLIGQALHGRASASRWQRPGRRDGRLARIGTGRSLPSQSRRRECGSRPAAQRRGRARRPLQAATPEPPRPSSR